MILERLLIETDLRVLVLDPNSDFVRLGQVRAGADQALAGRYEAAARSVAVYSARTAGERRLRLHVAGIDPATQAALLRLDRSATARSTPSWPDCSRALPRPRLRRSREATSPTRAV